MFISKLKAEEGTIFTDKMEGMFKDLATSNSLLAEFNNQHAAELPMTFHINVLTATYWPDYLVQPVRLPDFMKQTCELFESFHDKKFEGRRLTWQHSLAYVSLNAFYPKNVKKQFHVSLFQSVVLLLFNESDSLTFGELLEGSGKGRAAAHAQVAVPGQGARAGALQERRQRL